MKNSLERRNTQEAADFVSPSLSSYRRNKEQKFDRLSSFMLESGRVQGALELHSC